MKFKTIPYHLIGGQRNEIHKVLGILWPFEQERAVKEIVNYPIMQVLFLKLWKEVHEQ
jgi:hypothetical protein